MSRIVPAAPATYHAPIRPWAGSSPPPLGPLLADPGPAGGALRRLVPAGLLFTALVVVQTATVAHANRTEGIALGLADLAALVLGWGSVGRMVMHVRTIDDRRLRLLVAERRARAALEDALESGENVLAIVGHELRSPLNTIATATALLIDGIPPAQEQARYLAMVKRAADSMARLIQDLLDRARIEKGSLRVVPIPTRLDRLIAEACGEMDQLAVRKHLLLRCDVRELPRVQADSERVRQILANLLTNAIKFTPSGGVVVVSATATESHVRVFVEDSGPGVPEEELPHLFEPFWQRTSPASHDGVGLGLYIVRALVEAHGGEITVTSSADLGSRFDFTLPRSPSGYPTADA